GRHYHEDPHVPNFGEPGRGPRLSEGMTIAIEPMITMCRPEGVLAEDGWTISSADGSLAAHFEHTVAILADGPRILTPRVGVATERARLAALGHGASKGPSQGTRKRELCYSKRPAHAASRPCAGSHEHPRRAGRE